MFISAYITASRKTLRSPVIQHGWRLRGGFDSGARFNLNPAINHEPKCQWIEREGPALAGRDDDGVTWHDLCMRVRIELERVRHMRLIKRFERLRNVQCQNTIT
ncbi:hypothetical protein RF11_13911 [Thelohanellus kitauei]|uniref:Uncharacterized protein n=1 Tax=Thelohanellus kitauei TaxID=669202 RepID=A0A0C2I6W4_THEKT|nr:hypothetical protein RF11_13911 [Thelohanellus kitauei]